MIFLFRKKIGENIVVFDENNVCMYVGTANFAEKNHNIGF
jgi:hypothetical protein